MQRQENIDRRSLDQEWKGHFERRMTNVETALAHNTQLTQTISEDTQSLREFINQVSVTGSLLKKIYTVFYGTIKYGILPITAFMMTIFWIRHPSQHFPKSLLELLMGIVG
jgi:hypothetical protein